MATNNTDYANIQTEKELAKLEKRIAKLYKEARDELEETVKAYFESFEKRDEEMKKLIGTVQNGKEWAEADYKQWRLNQIGRGKRFEALRDLMAERYTQANEVAIAYVNDETSGIYSLNRNYSAYTIDKATGGSLTMPKGKLDASWILFDESTVRRLAVEQPGLMPNYPAAKALKRGIDLAYGKKQITSAVTSAILQGKSIKDIADDLQSRITDMNRASAIRTARTAITGAQNGGRQDTYQSAQKMGIKMRKQWLATLDSRTRHSHAMLDGEIIEVGGKYSNGCRYPGDPHGKPHEVYNCRCTEIAVLDDVDTSDAQRRARDPESGESVLISDMSYQEWAGWKKAEQKVSIDSASTIQDIEKLFREKDWFVHGTGDLEGWRSDDEMHLEGISVEHAKMLYTAYDDVFAKYPNLVGRLSAPVAVDEGNSREYASTLFVRGYGNAGISVNTNRKVFGSSTINEKYMETVATGWHPEGTTIKGVFYHEIGHCIDAELSAGSKTLVSSAAQKEILKRCKMKVADISGNLSQYATKGKQEFFAECFAEYMESESPRKMATVFGEYLEELMKGL